MVIEKAHTGWNIVNKLASLEASLVAKLDETCPGVSKRPKGTKDEVNDKGRVDPNTISY